MGREAFKDAIGLIASAGFNIIESDYEELIGSWHITLDTVRKIRLAWDNSENILSVEEETKSEPNGLTAWKCIFASQVSDRDEIPAMIKEILKNDK